MKKGLIDLHIHTTYSKEGITTKPSDIIEQAIIKGVETLAITDHNTTMGCIQALKYIERNPDLCKDLNFITGIEISCDTTNVISYEDENGHLRSALAGGVHMLGYGIDPYHQGYLDLARFYGTPTGMRTLAIYKYIKRYYEIEVNKDVIFNVVKEAETDLKAGVEPEYVYDSILHRCLTTGRNAPLGRKNQYQNFAKNIIKRNPQVYEDFLFRVKKTFEAKNSELDEIAKQDIFEMMQLIEDSGGVAVLAHPTFYRPKRELSVADFELLSNFIEKVTGHYNEYTGEFMRGIVGIELLHGSSFDDQFRFKFYDNLIKSKGLYITGGSDSHIVGEKNNNLGYIRHNFSIKKLQFVDDLEKLLILGQKATSIKKQKERDYEILKGPQCYKNVDEQVVLFNDYKQVKASEIIESQTISKKLLSFENEISACMFNLKEKLYIEADIEKNDHKNPDKLQEWTKLYSMYMLSIIDNKDIFFGNREVFNEWLQHRLEFITQAEEELYEMSVLDADNQLKELHEVEKQHFTLTRSIMKNIMNAIEAEIVSYSAEKVLQKDYAELDLN